METLSNTGKSDPNVGLISKSDSRLLRLSFFIKNFEMKVYSDGCPCGGNQRLTKMHYEPNARFPSFTHNLYNEQNTQLGAADAPSRSITVIVLLLNT